MSQNQESKNVKILALILYVACIHLGCLINTAEASGMKCKGVEMKDWDQEKMWLKECMKEDPKAKSVEEALKNACFAKCLMMKRGIVDEGGMTKNDKLNEFVQMTSPKEVHADLMPKYVECATTNGPKIKEANGSCESYGSLFMCMEEKLKEACGGK